MIPKKTLSIASLLLSANLASAAEIVSPNANAIVKVGLGIGVPYGLAGTTVEIGSQYCALIGGLGYGLVVPELMWAYGLKAYFNDVSQKWRPNIAVLFGTTGFYLIKGAVEAEGPLHGIAGYFNLDHDIGGQGAFVFTYGLGIVTHEGLPSSVIRKIEVAGFRKYEMGIPIKVSFGLNYRFGG